jgi:Predicted membrane protein (DUF2207)
MQIPGLSAQDAHFLLFPAVLLAFYLVCWLGVGRNPKIETIAPQYEPPAGVSPGIARYILTGGSDGTTLAAVLAQLAARKPSRLSPEREATASRYGTLPTILLPKKGRCLEFLASATAARFGILQRESRQYFRSTPITRPCTCTDLAGTTIGFIAAFDGCRRMSAP